MTQPISNIPVHEPFVDDSGMLSGPSVRWLQKLITITEPPTLYTPVVTSGTGAFTTVSAKGRYRKLGKLVFIQITITITSNGTASGFVIATLPFNAVDVAGVTHILSGRANAISGKSLDGVINPNAGFVSILAYDNGYPGASGETLVLSGFYEIG
jgi:hypothetical protein